MRDLCERPRKERNGTKDKVGDLHDLPGKLFPHTLAGSQAHRLWEN